MRLTALGNCVYSLTYPRDVTTTSELGELKCNAAAMLESCMDLTVFESPNGSSTMCTRDAVANAAIDELPCIAKAVIGTPTSDRIELDVPLAKSKE